MKNKQVKKKARRNSDKSSESSEISAREALKRMKDFAARKEAFVAAIKKS